MSQELMGMVVYLYLKGMGIMDVGYQGLTRTVVLVCKRQMGVVDPEAQGLMGMNGES